VTSTLHLAAARHDDVDAVRLTVRPGRPAVSARPVFDPSSPGPHFVLSHPGEPAPRQRRSPFGLLRSGLSALMDFYRDPLAVLALLISAVLLIYVGGAVMFWFHAIELGEGGPQISHLAHWLLDSTFGFVGLLPVLVLIMPISAWAAQRASALHPRVLPWVYAGIAGTLFSFATVPGPIAHDMLVGRGTWIADKVTTAIGDPAAPLTPTVEYPLIAALTQQLGAAIPLYIVITGLAVLAVRRLLALRRRAN
jgi:hypothetical protein